MSTLLPGTEVVARGLRWEVAFTEQLGAQTLYRLRGAEGAMLGRELDLLSPFESIEPIRHEMEPTRAAPLPNWLVYHQAFLLEQALGPDALLAVQPGRLRLEPYQLVPVLRALRMSRVRLLLADGVGLGKTVQAGLVLTELLARRLAHRILVVSPAGPLLHQWREEMSDRFGLRLEVVDRARLEEVRRSEELGANPFDYLSMAIASPDFLKQERILEQLERASYDVVVLDEAHHYMDLGALGEREDSQRRRLAETLSRRCDSLLLLTATPHDGNDRSFASLCELLDPSLVDGKGGLRGERFRAHVVRRLKSHIKDPETGELKFKERQVTPCPVVASDSEQPAFVELQHKLLALIAPVLRRAFRNRQYTEVLSFIALLKRSVSTAYACGETLRVVADRYHAAVSESAEEQDARRQRLRSLRDYQRRLERFGNVSTEEEEDRELLEAEEVAQRLAGIQREIRSGATRLTRVAGVTEALEELIGLAADAQEQDPKLQRLVEEVRGIRTMEPHANILVYTEYVDSQRAALRALRNARLGEVLTISGDHSNQDRADGGSTGDRQAVTDRFQWEDNLILVSTDAAAEGLNLHQRCHHLIHLELPFNPNRLEQRNGRIDRYGQTQDPVVRYFFLQGTFEERILFRLIAKYERQRERLTFVPNTLGLTCSTDAAAERLLKPLLDDEARLFQPQGVLFTLADASEDGTADEATRELLEEIDRSLHGFEHAARTRSWLGDVGINAEERLQREAQQARSLGERANGLDLLAFVRDAVRLDGGGGRQVEPDVFELNLPPHWLHGLDELPGYDHDSRRLLLTTTLHRVRDSAHRRVGYLGRAHPLVRRALDRVRNRSFGASGTDQDARVSAVIAAVSQPEILFTFLGRVSSAAGREFERVLAVRVSAAGAAEMHRDPAEWSGLAEADRALRTAGLWERYFQDWGAQAERRAREEAQRGFSPMAVEFTSERERELTREAADLQAWLESRAAEIGSAVPPPNPQASLFDAPDASEPSHWRTLPDAAERVAGLASDAALPSALRNEGETLLRLYQRRRKDLHARLRLGSPEMVLLGLLMLIPEASRAV